MNGGSDSKLTDTGLLKPGPHKLLVVNRVELPQAIYKYFYCAAFCFYINIFNTLCNPV
jgi:hypothetical protein